jgi:hypothetical protein
VVEIFLRLFVAATNEEVVTLVERLRSRLEGVAARVQVTTVRPYWKTPGQQEVCVKLGMFGDPGAALSTLTLHLGTGWAIQQPGEAIWNPGAGAAFVEPLVQWAHAEVTE